MSGPRACPPPASRKYLAPCVCVPYALTCLKDRRGIAGHGACQFGRAASVDLAGLVDQHDGNPVADRIGQMRTMADQFLRRRIEFKPALRLRAHQRLKHLAVKLRCLGHCKMSSDWPPRSAYSISVTSVSRRVDNDGASSRACLSSGSKSRSIDSELIKSSSSASDRVGQSADSSRASK